MKIQWYGHSCFIMETDNGTRILTDPYDETVGYPMHQLDVDVLTLSHDHFDHNNKGMVMGDPLILESAGTWEFQGIKITGIPSFHDEMQGQRRGSNLIFLFEADGLRVAHMGDLGAVPNEAVLEAVGNLDVMMVPIGGTFTIDPPTACKVANLTHTNVLIPMHYQTRVLQFSEPLIGVDQLFSVAKNCSVHKLNQSDCSITRQNLGEDRILVLDYVHKKEETEET